jgi:RimJ/RimL family protein N-acetyltransferase
MSAARVSHGSSFATSGTPVLATERLVLRAPRLDDIGAIAALANNRKIAEMTALIPHPYTPADAENWIALASDGAAPDVTLVVLAKTEGGAVIGACGYDHRGGDVPEIGFWIGEPFWGRGYATEAVRTMIGHAFTATGIAALSAACRMTNLASRRVLDKCGFQWTGAGLCRIRALGALVPSDRFRLERRTWASLRDEGGTRLPRRVAGARSDP